MPLFDWPPTRHGALANEVMRVCVCAGAVSQGHEALVFRDKDGAQQIYEHESMVRHMVGLMATANG